MVAQLHHSTRLLGCVILWMKGPFIRARHAGRYIWRWVRSSPTKDRWVLNLEKLSVDKRHGRERESVMSAFPRVTSESSSRLNKITEVPLLAFAKKPRSKSKEWEYISWPADRVDLSRSQCCVCPSDQWRTVGHGSELFIRRQVVLQRLPPPRTS